MFHIFFYFMYADNELAARRDELENGESFTMDDANLHPQGILNSTLVEDEKEVKGNS